VFSRAKFSLFFHVYKMSAVGIRTLDGILCVEITATWEDSSTSDSLGDDSIDFNCLLRLSKSIAREF
jgi:hypothetical protein